MNLSLPFLYWFWFVEYCPQKNKSTKLRHVTSILVCCIFAEDHHKKIWYSHVKCGSKFSIALAKAKFYNFRLQDEGSIKTNALNHQNRLLYSIKLLFPMVFFVPCSFSDYMFEFRRQAEPIFAVRIIGQQDEFCHKHSNISIKEEQWKKVPNNDFKYRCWSSKNIFGNGLTYPLLPN